MREKSVWHELKLKGPPNKHLADLTSPASFPWCHYGDWDFEQRRSRVCLLNLADTHSPSGCVNIDGLWWHTIIRSRIIESLILKSSRFR